MASLRETDLYPPVKAFLEAQGYTVKGEVGPADVVACRGDEAPVIVELKTRFTLGLVHQGIARQAVTDAVYLAIPHVPMKRRAMRDNLKLCRMLGLGLMRVRRKDGFVEVLCDPGAYRPRPVPARKARLLREFARRVGDPASGGATRGGLVTAYRQDALRCAAYLATEGPAPGRAVAQATGVSTATRIMREDHYGWFERVERGVYALTPNGEAGLARYGAPRA